MSIEKVLLNKNVTVDYIYKNLLNELTKILEDGICSEMVFDMSLVSYIEVEAIIPLTRAMIAFARCLQNKCGDDYRIRVVPSESKAFTYLFHIGMWKLMDDWYYIEEFENQYVEYIERQYSFRRYHKILSFPMRDVFIKIINKNGLEECRLLNKKPIELEFYYRDEIENVLRHKIEYIYHRPLSVIYDNYGAKYHCEVMEDLTELAANAVYHGNRESFVYFQTQVRLPMLTRVNNTNVYGQFISVGDLGIGLNTSMMYKKENNNEKFLWDDNEFLMLCKKFSEANNVSENMYRNNSVLNDCKGIFEALYFSYKKEQSGYLRCGLYRLIRNVTYEKGIVCVSSGRCKIIFNSISENFAEFENAIKEILYLKERKNVITYQRKIEGLQVDVEIRGENEIVKD